MRARVGKEGRDGIYSGFGDYDGPSSGMQRCRFFLFLAGEEDSVLIVVTSWHLNIINSVDSSFQAQ